MQVRRPGLMNYERSTALIENLQSPSGSELLAKPSSVFAFCALNKQSEILHEAYLRSGSGGINVLDGLL